MADQRAQRCYLRRLDLFEGIADEEVGELASIFGSRDYPAGTPIIRQEAPAEQVFIVLEGSVRLFHRGPDGREITVDVVGPGRLLGISALFGLRSDGLLAEAASEVVLGEAETETFLRLLSEHPPVMFKLATQLGQRLLQVEQQLDRLALTDARTRLAGALLRFAEQDGETLAGGERRIRPPLTHAAWARQIGASRETVTRLLGSLEDDGSIRREGRRIVVRDPRQLAESSGFAAE